MSRRPPLSLVAIALLALLCGCAPRIDAELPDVVVTQHEVEIPGWLPESILGDPPPISYDQKHAETGIARTAYSAVTVYELALEARAGVKDLSFIRRLRVTIADAERAGEPGAAVEIARYERTGSEPVGPVLLIARDPPADVLDVWRAETSRVTVEMAGNLPTESWSVDVSIRASAKLRY